MKTKRIIFSITDEDQAKLEKIASLQSIYMPGASASLPSIARASMRNGLVQAIASFGEIEQKQQKSKGKK